MDDKTYNSFNQGKKGTPSQERSRRKYDSATNAAKSKALAHKKKGRGRPHLKANEGGNQPDWSQD